MLKIILELFKKKSAEYKLITKEQREIDKQIKKTNNYEELFSLSKKYRELEKIKQNYE